MLIRTRADKVILSFLLLAGIGSCIAQEDGYSYEKPAIAFNTGYNNVGAGSQGFGQSVYQQQSQYVGASSTVKPAAAVGGYTQQTQSYLNPAALGSLLGGNRQTVGSQAVSSVFGQQSGQLSGFGQTARPQQSVSFVSKPQTVSSGFQGFGQQSGQQSVGYQGVKQQTGFGQTVRPQQSVSYVSKPQTVSSGFQGFGQQSGQQSVGYQGVKQQTGFGQTVRPQQSVSFVSKPQTVSSGFQGFGQQSGFAQTSRPQQVVSSGYQGVGQQSVFGQAGQPQKVVTVTSKPQILSSNYQGYGQQTVRPQPAVSIISKPVTSGYQGSVGLSGQLSGLGQSGQYQTGSSTVRPQTSFGLGLSGQKPAVSTSFGGSQGFSQSTVKPSLSLSGPLLSSTVRPQTSFAVSQSNLFSGSRPSTPSSGFSQGVSQTSQYQGGQYNQQATVVKPTVSSSPRPQTSFGAVSGQYQGGQYNQQLSGAGPSVLSTARPQTSFGGVSGQYQGGQYNQQLSGVGPSVSSTARPQTSFGGVSGQYQGGQYNQQLSGVGPSVSSTAKPQTSFTGYQTGQSSVFKPSTVSIGFGQSSSGASQSGQYQGGQQAVKPSTGFSSTSGQYQRPSVVSTPRPQSNFGASQGFAQTTYQKPQAIQSTYTQTVQKPQVLVQTASTTARPTVIQSAQPQLTYLPPQSQTLTVTAKPQTAFQGFTGSPSTSRPATVKPQTSFNAFQSFGQSTQQKPAVTTTTFSQYGQQAVKPAVVTGQYQRPVVSTTVKPQTTFGGYQGSSQLTGGTFQTGILQGNQVSKPASFGVSSQTSQYQVKPQVGQYQGNLQVTGQYQKPVVSSVSGLKPQTSFTGSQSFVQGSYQKPLVSQSTTTYGQSVSSTARPQVGQYQGNLQLSGAKPSTGFSSGLVQTGQYQKPIISVSKPQSNFGVSQSFGQVNKPASFGVSSQTSQYQVKPQVGQYQSNLQLTGQYQKPVVPSVSSYKPQTSFAGSQSFVQGSYQKPQVGQSTSTYGQSVSSTARPQVGQYQGNLQVSGQYQKPVVPSVSGYKPQTSFAGSQSFVQGSYQKPQVGQSTSTYGQSVSSTARPQVGQYQGNLQLSAAKPSTGFSSGLVQTGQYQKPVQTFGQINQVIKPASFGVNTQTSQYQVKPQVGQYQGNLQLTSQYKKPQTTFTGSQTYVQPQKPQVIQSTTTYGQSVQVPKVQTVNYGQGASSTVSPTVIQTARPQLSYLPPQSQTAKLTVTAKPQTVFQGFTGSSTTSRPVIATVKPQIQQSVFVQKPVVTTTTFSQYGQQPTVITGQYQAPIVSTTLRPQVSVATTSVPQYQQPTRLPTPAIKTPAIFARVDSVVAQPLAPSQSLEYLPPKGAKLPNNIARASGAVQSQSFFDLASATANQVVDVAQEQKLAQASSQAQEQKVDGLNFRGNFDKATNQGQAQDSTNVYQSVGGSASTVGASTPQVSVSQQNLDDTQTALLQASFQAGNQAQLDSLNYQGSQAASQQFAQPQTSPSQQVVQAQLRVLDLDQAASDDIQDQYEAASQNIDYAQYRTVDDNPVAESQVYGQYYQPNSNVDNSQYSAGAPDLGNTFQVVGPPIEENSQLQDPQPLNPEEQQVRQLEEKADSDKEDHAVKSLQPGSYVGPHVNKDSDKEYNVFDYDQYGADPADTETY